MITAQMLRTELADVMVQTKTGTLDAKVANAISSLAGKMVQSTVAQLRHCQLRGEEPNIEFLTEFEEFHTILK
jgi:hypothetical protein